MVPKAMEVIPESNGGVKRKEVHPMPTSGPRIQELKCLMEGFPISSVVKNFLANAGNLEDVGLIPGT